MNIKAIYNSVGRFIFHHPKVILGICCVLTTAALFLSVKISIKADLKELLPDHFETVQGLKNLDQKYGGNRFLVVGLEAKNEKDAIRFYQKIGEEIKKHPMVYYFTYERPVKFVSDHLPLYLKEKTLVEIESYLARKREDMKHGAHPIFDEMFFTLEEEPTLSEIIKNNEGESESFWGSDYSPYYQNEDGTLFSALIKPKVSPQNYKDSKTFFADIKTIIEKTQPGKFGEGVNVFYAGGYQKMLEQEQTLRTEMRNISLLVLTILALIIFLYFRSIKSLFFVGIPLFSGIIWTGALTYLFIGQVNLVTSFGVAILAGLGSDYAIYLLSRYQQEIESGQKTKAAFRMTFSGTSQATRIAVITTMIAFLVLSFSDFRGFAEFGLVGFFGSLMNFIAFHTFFPALLVLFYKNKQSHQELKKTTTGSFIAWPMRFSKVTTYTFLVAVLLSTTILHQIFFIEYDLYKLQNTNLPSFHSDRKFNNLLKNQVNPAIVSIEENPKTEKIILQTILKEQSKDHSLPMIQGGAALSSFVPDQQSLKIPTIAKIQNHLKNMDLKLLGKSQELSQFFLNFDLDKRIRRETLPKNVTQMFMSPDNKESLIFIFEKTTRDSTEKVKAFVQQIKSIQKASPVDFQVVSDTLIITDIIELIETEAPLTISIVLFLCFLFLWYEFKSWHSSALILSQLFIAILIFLGLFSAFGFRFNFFNVSAVPILIGIGLDSFIHFFHYFEEKNNLKITIKKMAPAIFMANLTTVVGFGGLIGSGTEAMRSVGWLVLIGTISITVTAIFCFPAILNLRNQKLNLASQKPLDQTSFS